MEVWLFTGKLLYAYGGTFCLFVKQNFFYFQSKIIVLKETFFDTKEVKADEDCMSGKQHWAVLSYPKNHICCLRLNDHISAIVFICIKNKLFPLLSESELTKESQM
jgi:hypothetical protein